MVGEGKMVGENGGLASIPQICNPSNNGLWCFLVVDFMIFVAFRHRHKLPYHLQNFDEQVMS